jgi:hypothetical protein
MRLRKILIRALIVLFILATTVLVLRTFLNYATGHTLEKYLARAKDGGAVLRVKELIPDCPGTENGARLWKAAVALLDLDDADKSGLSKALEDSFYGRPLNEESRSKLASIILKNKRTLDLAAEASALPCLHLGIWDDLAKGMDEDQMTTVVNMIQMTGLLAVETLLHADRGEIVLALEECRTGMRLAERLMDEPSLINAAVAVANMKRMSLVFGRVVSGKQIDQKTLASWISELDALSWRLHWAKTFPVERASSLEMGLRMIKGDAGAVLTHAGSKGPYGRFWFWLMRPVLRSEVLWFQNACEDMDKVATLPYYEQREFIIRLSQRLNTPPWYFRMIGTLFPDFQAPCLKEASLEAVMLATRAGLACKMYSHRTGRYPGSLKALVPDLLPEIPIDPFTGKPLVYRMSSSELIIYSVGSNEKDDRGRGTYLITQLVTDKDDDWAWREKISP